MNTLFLENKLCWYQLIWESMNILILKTTLIAIIFSWDVHNKSKIDGVQSKK